MTAIFKNQYSGRVDAFWRGDAKMLPAGFQLMQTLATGMVVRRGTPVCINVTNHTANICKTAKVLAGGTTTKPRINKGNLFVVGDKITKVGGAVATISSINSSNADYDELTLSSAITGLAENDILAETDATAGAAKYEPNAVVGADLEINGFGLPTLDVAYDALVLEPSLDCPVLSDWKAGFTLKNNPNILFIAQ